MSTTQVVAQYPEHGFDVLEDEFGQFLMTEKEVLVPLKDKPRASVHSLIKQYVHRKVPAVEMAY